MNKEEICKMADDLATKHNPEGLSPFPFERIQKDNEKDLFIFFNDQLENSISGATIFDAESNKFYILVNKNKPKTRQHFTTAHELGHYFLHKELIKKEGLIDGDNSLDGGNILYRADNYISTEIETEANNFAASLIMPHKLVVRAWEELKDVEKCASIFNVSVSAMAIRLERLGLI